MTHILEVINNNEPLNIFGWPLFLPVCIARDYIRCGPKKMQKIIAALKRKISQSKLTTSPARRMSSSSTWRKSRG